MSAEEQDLEVRLRRTLSAKAGQFDELTIDSAGSATTRRRRSMGFTLALVGMAAALVVAVLVARTGTEPDLADTPANPTIATNPLRPLEPTVDKAIIRQWISETKRYYGVSRGDPCPAVEARVPDGLVMTLSILEPPGEPCTVVAFAPLHPGYQGNLGYLPMGEYDEEGNLLNDFTGSAE